MEIHDNQTKNWWFVVWVDVFPLPRGLFQVPRFPFQGCIKNFSGSPHSFFGGDSYSPPRSIQVQKGLKKVTMKPHHIPTKHITVSHEKISPKNTPTAMTWWVVFFGLDLYQIWKLPKYQIWGHEKLTKSPEMTQQKITRSLHQIKFTKFRGQNIRSPPEDCLVGGWTIHEKYERQIGSFPQGSVWK